MGNDILKWNLVKTVVEIALDLLEVANVFLVLLDLGSLDNDYASMSLNGYIVCLKDMPSFEEKLLTEFLQGISTSALARICSSL